METPDSKENLKPGEAKDLLMRYFLRSHGNESALKAQQELKKYLQADTSVADKMEEYDGAEIFKGSNDFLRQAAQELSLKDVKEVFDAVGAALDSGASTLQCLSENGRETSEVLISAQQRGNYAKSFREQPLNVKLKQGILEDNPEMRAHVLTGIAEAAGLRQHSGIEAITDIIKVEDSLVETQPVTSPKGKYIAVV